MADHQTTVTPPTPPPASDAVILPRSQEVQTPETGDPNEKAAREAKERMSKTQGFWNRLAPAKEEQKSDKPAEAEAEKPEKKEEKPVAVEPDAKEEPEAKPDKKPKGRKKEKETEIDPIELARATGQEIAREIAKANQASNVPRGTKPTEPETDVELPEEFRPDVAVFEEMARLDPKRYGNIKQELARYARAESEYIEKWEKEHEGETFDGDSDEHDAFYAKIRPNYEQKDFKLAEKSLLKQEVRRELSEDLRTREAETEQRRERASQITPEVDQTMFSTVGDIIRELDPKNADLAKDVESLRTLRAKNPLLNDVLGHVHNEIKPVVTTIMRLFRNVDQVDPQNPIQTHIFNTIFKAEDALMRLPMKDRYDDEGRLFATQEEYSRMSPAEKARHWFIGEREALALIHGQAMKRTKFIYEAEREKVTRYMPSLNATENKNQPPEKKAETPPNNRPDNGSPSVSGRGTLPVDGQSGATKPTTGRDLFYNRILGA